MCLVIASLIMNLIKEDRTNLNAEIPKQNISQLELPKKKKDIEIIIGTFLGNEKRNYYGENSPDSLNVKWKTFLGKGKSDFSSKVWYGAGWTGQPLLNMENDTLFLYHGAFDHNLKKIKAETGKLVWQYKFDDIIKGTGTISETYDAGTENYSYSILQGSRRGIGTSLGSENCFSLRSVSLSGEENWRYNVKRTISPSRDVDGSPLIINDTVIAPLENGFLSFLDPNKLTINSKGYYLPLEIKTVQLFDNKHSRKNIVFESSPCIIGDIVYATAGSGYVFGINKITKEKQFEFYIGSDLDGSPSVTNDSCLLISVEKQYINGKGGVFKLNPEIIDNPVIWYFPVKDKNFADWQGGVVGSVAVKDNLSAFTGIDGFLYLIDHNKLDTVNVKGPDGLTLFSAPLLLDKFYCGPSISTPIIIENKVIACTYSGIYLFEISPENKLILLDKFSTGFEATPICYNNNIYVASRDGYLYCFSN